MTHAKQRAAPSNLASPALERGGHACQTDSNVPSLPPGLDPASLRTLIVVPTLNESAHIETVLTELLAQVRHMRDAQLVVVDGGSTDGTRELVAALAAKHANLQLLHNPAKIQSAGVNLAVRKHGRDAQVLVRCDAHAIYPEDFCRRLLASLTRTEADAVVVPMLSEGASRLQRAVAWASNSAIGTGGSAHRGRGARSGFVDHGHHAAFVMDTFRKVGGYDESFTHNEDAELDCRQRALGGRIYLDTELELRYLPRATWSALFRQYFKYGAGRSRTVRRHPGSLRLRQLAVVANLPVMLFAVSVGPLLPPLLLLPTAYLTALACASVKIALRERSVDGLLAGPAAAVMHSAWALGFLHGTLTQPTHRWSVAELEPLLRPEARMAADAQRASARPQRALESN